MPAVPAAIRPGPDRPASRAVEPARPAKPAPRRRPGSFLRAVQLFFSVLIMTVVPLAAMVLSYGYGNGEPLATDAVNLVRDLRDLLGIRAGFTFG
jgi:hypothetical protein